MVRSEEASTKKKNKKMCDKTKDITPQVSKNLTTDSDREKDPVVSAGPMDSGEDHAHDFLNIRNENPFIRRDSINRTPPRQRRHSNSSREIETSRESAKPLAKRPREDTPPNKTRTEEIERRQKELMEIKRAIERLKNCSKELAAVVKSTPNTKAEIKKGTNVIAQLTEVLTKRWAEWEEHAEEVENDTPLIGESEIKRKAVLTKTIGVQVNMDKEDENIECQIEAGSTYEDFRDILSKEWKEGVYKTVIKAEGNPIKAGDEYDIAIVVDVKEDGTRGLAKEIKGRYPDIDVLMDGNMKEGEVEFLQVATKMATSRGDTTERAKYIYLLPIEVNETGDKKMEKYFKVLNNFGDLVQAHGRKNVAVASLDAMDGEKVRKLLECAFYKRSAKIKYCIPAVKQYERQKSRPESRKKHETVVIRAGGKPYSEILKEIKKDVDIDKLGLSVKKIHKSKVGDVVLTVQGDEENAKALGEEIKNKTGNEASRKKKAGAVFIFGIDAAITEEELKEEIAKSIHLDKEKIEITSLRPDKYEQFTAVVELPKEYVRKISDVGKIKIGWVNCTVKERVQIARCFRCLEYGHVIRECKAANHGEICVKCGQNGHRAKDCPNESFCTKCNIKGHRPDQIKCPRYKKMIEKERKRRNQTSKSMTMEKDGSLHNTHGY